MIRRSFILFALAVLVATSDLQTVQAQSKPTPAELHSTIEARTVKLNPSGATFQIPERWLDWHGKFKNNFHLSRAALEKVKNAEGEWDKEYAEVVNAVLPFSSCAAHVGGEGWGRDAVSFGDLQVRAYMVEMTPQQVQEKVAKEGVAQATKLSRKVSVAQSQHGDWRLATITYQVWYGDYGGTAKVDMFAREIGMQTLVLTQAIFWGLSVRKNEKTRNPSAFCGV